MDALAEYVTKRDWLVGQLTAARRDGSKIRLKKSTSNLFRPREGSTRAWIDVRPFHRVLSVDPVALTADVEGMTTYEEIVEETLKYGLLPQVVPQLKTITAGGAVAGLGIESSSFCYGLVHETVEEMDVLVGDGNVVTCSPSQNEDLFYAFPNSYGTLGYALRLRIRLVRAMRFVQIRHCRLDNAAEYFDAIATLCHRGEHAYVDGTAFSRDEMYITTGDFVDDAPVASDYTYTRIYYKSIQRKHVDYLSARDYIWRWDTDWFWCSKHFYVQYPAVRLLATRRLLNSRTYQRVMRWSNKIAPASNGTESVIQDVDIPIENAERFFEFLFSEIGIAPVWVCPFRTSPSIVYPLYALRPGALYVNFGFWDTKPTSHEDGYYNRKIEAKAEELGGKKALYSRAYYDPETFSRNFGKPCYEKLKAKYDPDGVFPGLYEKAVRRQ